MNVSLFVKKRLPNERDVMLLCPQMLDKKGRFGLVQYITILDVSNVTNDKYLQNSQAVTLFLKEKTMCSLHVLVVS